jgi:hypothetical protein
MGLQATVGLCDVGGFENLPPGTAAQLKNKCTNKVQKMIEKLPPEPKPNSEPMLMGIASTPILQNPMLVAGLSSRLSMRIVLIFLSLSNLSFQFLSY